MKKTAVIDLGSNSIRMSIFDEGGNTLQAYRSTIRLSEGMSGDMLLKPEPQLRAVEALKEYKKIMSDMGIDRYIALCTAAVRKAKNQSEFLTLVKEKSGLELGVISGEKEAALDSLAVKKALDLSRGIICDIGGGSTELIGVAEGDKIPMVSIPYGSRGICEMFFAEGEAAKSIAEAQSFADSLVAENSWVEEFRGETLVGIGGTLRALAKLDLEDFGQGAVEGYETSAEHMTALIEKIEAADMCQRAKMPGIGERADIILGGLILLRAVLKAIEPRRIAVADVGVREGAFWDMAEGGRLAVPYGVLMNCTFRL